MEREMLLMVRDGLMRPLHEPYGALTIDTMTAYATCARRYVPRSLPVITIADGMDRALLVMVHDGLTGPLHEPYGALTIDTMTA
jgi:hypothetical protein